MVKCFLSHSSHDKKKYVEIVARRLGSHNCVYDNFTFEEGMKPLEEILKGLGNSQLFVIFVSAHSLESKWVKAEITEARRLEERGDLKRIFPILIDSTITYQDERIPQWMKEEYNLKLISRPVVAARRIKQRLTEISWDINPRLKQRKKIFVGRNELISAFEERIDDFDKPKPTCVIASGIEEIGRRSLLKRCFIKSNLVDEAHELPTINLSSQESLEDFLYKVYDLGFSARYGLKDLMKKSTEDKISLASKIITDLQNAQETICILDNGCIVTNERKIADWFMALIERVENQERLTFAIASKFRLLKHYVRKKDTIYTIDVPELDRKERNGLLKRCAEFESLELTRDDFDFFSNSLSGYPEQIFYAVDLIKELGIAKSRRDAHLISEFNSEKAQRLLARYESNSKAIELLYFLSEFDFISYDFIFDIVEEKEFYKIIDDFTASAVCELLGANKEYVRVNDTIRDYVRRNRLGLPESYKKKLAQHLKEFLNTYQTEDKDVSDYLYSLKQALIQGETVDDKYLIPSHFLRTMRELYEHHRRYEEVVRLADRVLQNEDSLENNIKHQIIYFLCLSLARLKKKDRFLNEVQKIHGAEHHFLMGLYYRLQGRFEDAIERLHNALEDERTSSRAKRELVQVLIGVEDFQSAIALAKQNYESNKTNPYHIQAYFNCIINSPKNSTSEDKLNQLLSDLEKVNSEKFREMFMTLKARFLAFYRGDKNTALNLIEDAINRFPNIIYPKLAKFDICSKFNEIGEMSESIITLENEINSTSHLYTTVLRNKCIFLAQKGELESALQLMNTKLNNYPQASKIRLKQKLESLYSSSNNQAHPDF